MNGEHIVSAWQAILDADLNARYWRYMGLRFSRRENLAKIFLAATASGTVASWSLMKDYPAVWQSLSIISAIVSVALPILDTPRKIAAMVDAQTAWHQLMNEYDELFRARGSTSEPDFTAKLSALKKREVEISGKTATLPSDDWVLSSRCQDEVSAARGIK